MALTPRAELMLYVAREVQLAEEILRPALERTDVVIADRYFYTAQVLASAGRDLPIDGDSPDRRDARPPACGRRWHSSSTSIRRWRAGGARFRRCSTRLTAGPSSRKGLTGSGLQVRLRDGYRAAGRARRLGAG